MGAAVAPVWPGARRIENRRGTRCPRGMHNLTTETPTCVELQESYTGAA